MKLMAAADVWIKEEWRAEVEAETQARIKAVRAEVEAETQAKIKAVWAEAEATIRAVQDQARAAQDQTRAAQDLTAIEDFLRQILIVAVEQRAGALSAEARERVATASVATLSGWLLEIHNSVDSLRNRLLGRDSGSTAPMRRCR